MPSKKWKLRKPISKQTEKALESYPPFLRELLSAREIKKADEAEKYLNPSYERDLNDPFLMKGMDKAVKRILKAIEAEEKILIFADYDTDGVPGAVVLTSFFDQIGHKKYHVHIPDRKTEAYGLTPESVEKIATEKASLIITIDCGITSVEGVKTAKKLGMDVVITDHHLPQEKIPACVAVVDNKQSGDQYDFKMLCGCAVAFQLARALATKIDRPLKPGWDKWLLDLVAISTVADMVPMVGENRTLTYFGLKVLRQTKRPGLIEMMKTSRLNRENINEDDIGFVLAPRLNTASRMSHANHSYYLLTTSDPAESKDIAKYLEDQNKLRKDMVEGIFNDVDAMLMTQAVLPNVIVAGNKKWGNGGLGLACNKIKDKYGKTVFLWGNTEGGEVKGSCRSDGSVNLVELMKLVHQSAGEKLFSDFGGHFMAGGFSISPDKVGLLPEKLNTAYSEAAKKAVEEEILVDKGITLDDVTWLNYDAVEQMGPYGMENPKPVFLLENIVIDSVKAFGNGGIHLDLGFRNSQGKKVSAIGFFNCTASEKFNATTGHIYHGVVLEEGQKIDLLVNLEKSTFKNYPELRLRIVDVQKAK